MPAIFEARGNLEQPFRGIVAAIQDHVFNRFAREELVPGIEFVPTYGNTLMGLACCKPWVGVMQGLLKYAEVYQLDTDTWTQILF